MHTKGEVKNHMSEVSYANAIGSMMYDMLCIKPGISFATGVISRFRSNPVQRRGSSGIFISPQTLSYAIVVDIYV